MGAPSGLLQLYAVKKRYSAPGGGVPVEVLSDIELEVASGTSLAVVGPSGSGKSTLLQIIGTLDRPNAGRILLGGDDFTKLNDTQLAEVRNRRIGFVFQSHHLLPQCSVLENVLVPTLVSRDRERRRSAPERARILLRQVGLEERLNHRPSELSGGERQRVAVVRALINGAKLLLADEPTGALDRASAENIATLLVSLNKEQGVTLIVVTHALELARKLDRILELRDGKLRPFHEP